MTAAEVEALRAENAELQVRVQELTTLAKAQADEIRSLNLRADQARGRGGW